MKIRAFALAILGLVISCGSATAASTGTPTAAPQLLARVPGTDVVYVVASVACAKGPCLRLYRSDDGGASFVRRAAPPVSAVRGEPTGSLDQLVFATPNDGYALEGTYGAFTLQSTVDGGRTWHRALIAPRRSVSVLAASSRAFYAVVATCSSAATCTDPEFARSAPGSAMWMLEPMPDASALSDATFSIAASSTRLYVDESLADGSSLLAISRDGGGHFTVASAPQLVGVVACRLTATSTPSLWAACPTGMMVSFWHSSDAGARFTSVREPQPFSGTGGGAFAPVSATTAYLDVGGASAKHDDLFRLTADGTVATPVCDLDLLAVEAMVFTSLEDGVAIGYPSATAANVMLITRDGGVHWSKVVLT